MLNCDSSNSIVQKLNMIYQNQKRVNDMKSNLFNFNSNINFIQCEIPKFLNEISYDLEILLSILNNMKCSNNNSSENNSLEKMLNNAKNVIRELERVNQNQQNYINELLCKNKLCYQCNRPIIDNQLSNNQNNNLNNLPQSTSINYDFNNNKGFRADYENKLNFDYNIVPKCFDYSFKDNPQYFEKLLNLSYSYGNNLVPNIINQTSLNSTQMNSMPNSYNDRIISNYNEKGHKYYQSENLNNPYLDNNQYIKNLNYENVPNENNQFNGINNDYKNTVINHSINNNNLNELNKNNVNNLNEYNNNNINTNQSLNKIERAKNIISEAFKDDKTIEKLKEKFGDDFENKIKEGDIDEEYLLKVEEALKEISDNNKNNYYTINNTKRQNNKNWYRPNFKNPYTPKPEKKFKNYNQNDLYNKMKLKKKITDNQYHYKEYPKSWSSSKDYFTNNKSYDKNYKKNTMKIPNIPK